MATTVRAVRRLEHGLRQRASRRRRFVGCARRASGGPMGGFMEQWLIAVSEPTILAIDFIALGVIVIGTLIAIKDGIALLTAQHEIDRHARRHLWMRYSHWLVAGLTF